MPALQLRAEDTVFEAARVMHGAKLGAISVADGAEISGIFTYRDLIERVILDRRDPTHVTLGEVMTRDVLSVAVSESYGAALRTMVQKDYTYLPVVDADGNFVGMLSMRGLLEHRIDELAFELDSLAKYVDVEGGTGG
jgi:CBS domain-containing protein